VAEHRVRCPYCGYLAKAATERKAYEKLNEHIKRDHKDKK
jgi:predicted small metal-binding protein